MKAILLLFNSHIVVEVKSLLFELRFPVMEGVNLMDSGEVPDTTKSTIELVFRKREYNVYELVGWK